MLPIVALILCFAAGMLYTGGFFSGVDFVTAFSKSDAPKGLVFGSFFSIVITMAFYIPRKVLSFRNCMDSIPEGFKSMVPRHYDFNFRLDAKGHD